MRYQGRNINPIKLWAEYVEFPPNMKVDDSTIFLPLVKCPNPEHETDKRHFQVNVEKPLVHCFANCGISGTYEHAISMIEGVTQREARKRILKHTRVGPVKKRTGASKSTSAISPNDLLYDTYLPPVALEYLTARGISAASIAKWELGWRRGELRIAIPARDRNGRLRFLICRATREKDQPKYLYPERSEKTRLLFGACHINLGMVRSQGIVLVEGSLDTIILHQHGFTNTVGILGSKLSEIQAKRVASMKPCRVYTMFDADGSGVAATISVIERLRHTPIKVCRYPKGKSDPAELTREEAARSIERAISVSEFRRLTADITRSKPRTKEEFSFG